MEHELGKLDFVGLKPIENADTEYFAEVARHGLEVVKAFVETAPSGRSQRHALDQLLNVDANEGVKRSDGVFCACFAWSPRVDPISQRLERPARQLLDVVSGSADSAIPVGSQDVIKAATRLAC